MQESSLNSAAVVATTTSTCTTRDSEDEDEDEQSSSCSNDENDNGSQGKEITRAPLLHETSIRSTREVESVALLREIFPDESDEDLRKLHRTRLEHSASQRRRRSKDASPSSSSSSSSMVLSLSSPTVFTSNLGRRLWNMLQDEHNHLEPPEEVNLPNDFLRLPSQKNDDDDICQWQQQLMGQLEQRVIRQHKEYQEKTTTEVTSYPSLEEEYCYTRALFRDVTIGLGMTLCEENGCIWVHSLLGHDGVRWFRPPPPLPDTSTNSSAGGGPAIQAGIRPGDLVLGIQGEALLPTMTNNHDHHFLLRLAVSSIQCADNPVVLHLQRVPFNGLHPLASTGPSLLDTTAETLDTSISEESVISPSPYTNGPPTTKQRVHPFVQTLALKGLIQNKTDELKAHSSLMQYMERTRHWESASSFRIDAKTFKLRPHFDSNDLSVRWNETTTYDEGASVQPYASSTPTLDPTSDSIPLEFLGSVQGQPLDTDILDEQDGLLGFQIADEIHSPTRKEQPKFSYPGKRIQKSFVQPTDIFIPLMGVRKGLCVRIVNTFLEEHRTAYTVWVYDVESGREWYAPVRFLSDFQELRAATGPLCRSIYHIPFPSGRWLAFGVREDAEPDSVRHGKCQQLENFLRTLCTLVYTDELHPAIAEIAIHVQSFLGCDSGLARGGDSFLHLQNYAVNNEPMVGERLEEGHSTYQMNVRTLLKRSIQRYTYRLFLLNPMKRLVDDFVGKARASGPTLKEIEALESQGRNVLKDRAMRDLGKIQRFLDDVQDLVLEGCATDFESISHRREFYALRSFIADTKGNDYLNKIIREAVREQVEIEIYVPLRSVVSRLLVNGWRYDDMEIHFKMQELRRRPQSMFKIPETEQSPSGWRSVSAILNDGVGRSTLPCAKLRAIVDAAKEITYVYSRERDEKPTVQDQQANDDETTQRQKPSTLGADDFLPIFIYSVVRADMERPCALCALLQTLCDQSSRIGETGYYLATFEGAIKHIQELDLTLYRTK